jgi:hypothetical protein
MGVGRDGFKARTMNAGAPNKMTPAEVVMRSIESGRKACELGDLEQAIRILKSVDDICKRAQAPPPVHGLGLRYIPLPAAMFHLRGARCHASGPVHRTTLATANCARANHPHRVTPETLSCLNPLGPRPQLTPSVVGPFIRPNSIVQGYVMHSALM